MKLTPPLKWHGGKVPLASRIVAMMPRHTHYVEPFAGGLAVLLAKEPEGCSEVANDLDGRVGNFWRVLQSAELFREFRRRAEAVPCSEWEWRESCSPSDDSPVSQALAFFVRCRQSMAGRLKQFSPLTRTRVRAGMNEQARTWLAAVDGLADVHARLRRVVVMSRPALDVIRTQDGPDTLFYLDPPYLPETRTSPKVYACEMSADDHADLLRSLGSVRGKFLLSGYRSALYDRAAEANGWHRTDFPVPNRAAAGESKRLMVECVWANYVPE